MLFPREQTRLRDGYGDQGILIYMADIHFKIKSKELK